ncbi:hypothetical protein [Brachyspira pilosicoli]|uniref:Lipoprotein n=1 Tax=Brachyspira pilosicoli (strain ATCC BAA-1826 / 95/1000) TaxID=759914 RepID=D8IBX9_BRAP9|nr:hypothetical protein [Brachyspira pilosicoli]ADK30652.1 conserved hypothetical protein [Brachyspira pilosicoli 95/1000]
MQKYFILLLSFIIFLLSCTSPNNPNDQNNNNNNNNNNNQSQRGEYQLLTDKNILSLSWGDKNKQEYFRTNWLNTFTNQIIIPAGVTTATRETDEKGTYLENGEVLGNFIYATNIEWKGTNWIGALYEDPRRPEYDSKWMLFHIDTDGNFMLGSAFGSGATGKEPPTEEYWKQLMGEGGYGSFKTGTIKDFNYNPQQ